MKMKAYKAQSSIEFLVFAGIAFLVVIIFVAASANEVREFRDQKKFFLIKDLALKLQKEVTIAASVENGYERSFNLPDRLGNNLDYFIITKNSTITVNSSKTAFSVRIPAIIGNFSKGINTITRIDGVIYTNSQLVVTVTDGDICQNAENFGLCGGLDFLFGAGYEATCCSEHSLCC